MTHLSVSDQIYHDITSEFLAVLGCNAERVCHIIHRVGVAVENWCTDCCGYFRTVCARSCSVRSSCEADLVVDDHVDRSTDSVVLESLHLEALVDDTLASHSSVTVHHDGHHLLAIFVLSSQEVLLGAGTSLHTWVHSLQVRRVRH